MYKVIEFYEEIPKDEVGKFKRVCFYWTCYPYAFYSPRVERFWTNRPTEKLDITKYNPSKEKFDPGSGLEKNAFQAITTYKRRPVILLSSENDSYDPKGLRGGEYFLVAPLRTTKILETNEYKYSSTFIWNSILYKYDSIFFLPDAKDYVIRESIILFERMTSLHNSWLTPMSNLRLTHDAQICLDAWLKNFIFGQVTKKFNENLVTYRELMGNDPMIKKQVTGIGKYLK